MNYNILVILLLIIIIFFYFNKMLIKDNINNNTNNNEHFTELLDVFNNLMSYTNKPVIIKNPNVSTTAYADCIKLKSLILSIRIIILLLKI